MRNIKITIEYEGTNYSGWQRQNNGISIQSKIEEAIYKITGEEISINGAGRTDAGVHAKGQVANFITKSLIPIDKFPYALNSKLPNDIVILEAKDTPMDFHSRYSSKGKTYSYSILNRKMPSPLLRKHTCFCPNKLNFEDMESSLKFIKGTHDFKAFRSTGSSVKTTVRNIFDINLLRDDELIVLYISADGFLYNMVRIIAGTLIEIGKGKIPPQNFLYAVEKGDRNLLGPTAPPEGLCLQKIYY